MPKYVYKCLECGQVYETVHSFGDTVEACSQLNEYSECSSTSEIQRIPQSINLFKKENKEAQVGQVVNDFIEQTKEEVKTYKKELQKWKYKK
jgi:predicted ATP-dependent serine protease